jgi:hypothetical protein
LEHGQASEGRCRNGLNRALGELERHNKDLLEDVLEHINFNRKIGQRTLSDDTLVGFIQVFELIPLRDEISNSLICSALPTNI